MNTNALRKKILDLAIHGKLVKQDPNDESATIVLEKIRAEKAEKIKNGELKAHKNDSYIFKYTGKSDERKADDNPAGLQHNRHYEKFADGRVKDIEDEIPFALPEGWEWASLSEIANIYTGNSINENEKNNKYSNVSNGLFYIATKDIDFEGVINYENGIKIPFSESKFKIAPAQSSLICIEGGSAGRKIGFINKEVCFVNKLCCLHCEFTDNLYLFYYLRSSTFIDLFNVNKSGLIGGVSLNLLKRIPIPLPPLAEQRRIVSVIEALFAQIDTLEKNKADLQTAVEQAKRKILDLAVHGKLVPQAPADEPASVMLEQLRAEKEAKIAAGEIKRGKNDSYIYKNPIDSCYYEKFFGKKDTCINEEIPFEVPANWQWERGKGIFYSMTTKIPSGYNFRYIDINSIDNQKHQIKSPKVIEVSKAPSRASREVREGDILFSLVRPYLENIALVTENYSDCIASTGFYICRPNNVVIPKYVFYIMTSQYVVKGLNTFMKGDNSPSITGDDITKWLYPIPPLAEQKRIVAKIEEILSVLDHIQSNLV